MDPQKKSALMQYTTAVKAVIYDAGRMQEILPMLDTRGGAIKAVQAVIAVIEKKKPIPPGIAPLLAVNTYMLLVDMAREIVRDENDNPVEPDPGIVKGVTQELMSTIQSSHGAPQPETMETAQSEQMEAPAEQSAEMAAGQEQPMGLVGRSMKG